MIRDRLSELQVNLANITLIVHDEPESFGPLDVFFTNVLSIREMIKELQMCIETVKQRQNECLTEDSNDLSDITKELNDVRMKIRRLSINIKQHLKEIECDQNTAIEKAVEGLTEKSEKELAEKSHKASANYRIRDAQHMDLTTRYRNLMRTNNINLAEYRDACRVKLQDKLNKTGRIVTEAQLQGMIESGDYTKYIQEVLTDPKLAQEQKDSVEARQKQLHNIEMQLNLLREMYYDMEILLEEGQNEMVEHINTYVSTTLYKLIKATEDTKSARQNQSGARRKKIMSAIIFIIVVTAVILYFFVP